MKQINRLILTALLFLTVAGTTRADIPPNGGGSRPRPEPPVELVVVISRDATASEARLEIPRSDLRRLLATTSSATGSIGPAPWQLAMAGLFLASAMAFGGLWIVRSRHRGSKVGAIAGITVVAAVGGFSFGATANLGPPPLQNTKNPGTLPLALKEKEAIKGKVRVTVIDSSRQTMYLILPPATEKTGKGEE